MKKKLAILAATLVMAAGPASADAFDDVVLFGSTYTIVEDVDFQNVRERNPRDGECIVDDIDRDGVITELDVTCFI